MSFYYSLSKLKQVLFLKNFGLLCANGKINPPTAVIWESTKRCNLSCIHCSSCGTYGNELSTEEIKGIVDQVSLFGVRNFQATGGEPFLRKDLADVLSYADSRGLKTGLVSNGYYIDVGSAKSVSNANVSLIQISVDGTKNIHNCIRGDARSFERAINAIRLLKQYSGHAIGVATTVMPQNIDSLGSLKEILISLDIDFWNIGIVMPAGRAKKNSSLFLTKDMFKSLMEFVIDAKKEIDVDVGENFPFLGRFDRKIRKTPKFCPVGILYCCIGADGHIRGCPDQPDTELYREGFIKDKSFEEIWKKGFERYRNREALKKDEKCMACANKAECLGGCWVMREDNMQCILNYIN
jgi:radical SAM protein with 4Fe4S-binding SPASM domain